MGGSNQKANTDSFSEEFDLKNHNKECTILRRLNIYLTDESWREKEGFENVKFRNEQETDSSWYNRCIANYDLNKYRAKISIQVNIHESLHKSWIKHIINGLREIETAAPRLHFIVNHRVKEGLRSKYSILITKSKKKNSAVTFGTIFQDHIGELEEGSEIHLSNDWENKKRSSVHEILHALGFGHEHKRKDAQKYFDVKFDLLKGEFETHQYLAELGSLTKLDPLSIMLYCEDEVMRYKKSSDPIWKLKIGSKENDELSELDKLGLNLVYPSSYGYDNYKPEVSENGMIYCGRKVMARHNFPGQDMTNGGRCGPKNGPNCPACRVFMSDKTEIIKKKELFQGMSGRVYCGKFFKKLSDEHDGNCGPNNGESCPNCSELID